MKKVSTVILGLLFLTGVMLNAQTSATQLQYELAQIRLNQARKAFLQGHIDIAHRLLHQSTEFFDHSIEYYELHGLILLHNGRYVSAIDSFEKVLEFPMVLHQSLEFERQLLALYYRSGQYEKLLDLIEHTSLLTSDAFFYRNMALAQVGADNLLVATQEAMALWPDDYRFYLPVLNHEQFPTLFLDNFTLLSHRATRNGDIVLTQEERSVFVAWLRRVTADNQLQLIQLARPWLAQDLNYTLLLRVVAYQEAQVTYEELMATGTEVDEIEFVAPQPMPIQAGLLADHINIELLLPEDDLGFLGLSSSLWAMDRNKDGYIDAWGRLQFVSEGSSQQWLPAFWVEDSKQMGQPTRAVFYRANGQPFYVLEQHNTSLVSLVIEDFPFVNQVRIESLAQPVEMVEELVLNQIQEDSIRVQRAGGLLFNSPRSLVYQIALTSLALDYESEGLKIMGANSVAVPYFNQTEPLLTDVNLLNVSYRMHEYMNNHLFRLLQIVDGEVIALWEDSNQQGFFSHFLAFKNGLPLYGRRAFVDGEGYVLYEHYEKGTWQGVAFTQSPAGFDYYEQWGGDDLRLKVWGFESDGYINAYTVTSRHATVPLEVQVNILDGEMPISEKLHWDFAQAIRWFNEQRN
jgi:tetratricopeptide (TPR) repeat protein